MEMISMKFKRKIKNCNMSIGGLSCYINKVFCFTCEPKYPKLNNLYLIDDGMLEN